MGSEMCIRDRDDGQGRRRPRHDKRRHLHRRNLESYAQSNGAVGEAFLYGYLSELYTSPRHARVDPAYRHAVVVHVLQYYAENLAQHEELPEDDPPFLSRQRRACRRGALGCDSSRATCHRPSASEATHFLVWSGVALGAP